MDSNKENRERIMGFSTIAILSPGNMGGAVGAQLGKSGYDVIT